MTLAQRMHDVLNRLTPLAHLFQRNRVRADLRRLAGEVAYLEADNARLRATLAEIERNEQEAADQAERAAALREANVLQFRLPLRVAQESGGAA